MSMSTTQAKWSGNWKKQRKFRQETFCFLLLVLVHVSSEKNNYQENQAFQPECVLDGFPGVYFNYSVKQVIEQYTEDGVDERVEVLEFFVSQLIGFFILYIENKSVNPKV